MIPQPPSIITKHDLYALFIHHFQDIHDAYSTLLASLPPSETAKTFTPQQVKDVENIQIDLLLQDTP
jgi:hypothetical protein